MNSLLVVLVLLHSAVAQGGTMYVFWNGTVILQGSQGSQFFLPAEAKATLYSNGAFLIHGDNVTFINATRVEFLTKPQTGVISLQGEPGNLTVYLLVPTNYSISYVSPQPNYFLTKNGFYNLSFSSGGNIILLYGTASNGERQNLEVYLVGGLIVVNSLLIALVVYTMFRRREDGSVLKTQIPETATVREERGEVDVSLERDPESLDVEDGNSLNERDKIVLEAVGKGASTLAELTRVTGLPKSTVYRRVKKLVRLGYVKEVREAGKVRYEVTAGDTQGSVSKGSG